MPWLFLGQLALRRRDVDLGGADAQRPTPRAFRLGDGRRGSRHHDIVNETRGTHLLMLRPSSPCVAETRYRRNTAGSIAAAIAAFPASLGCT